MIFDIAIGVALIMGIVQAIKVAELVPERFLPVTAIVVGVGVYHFFGNDTNSLNVLNGIMAALMAMGLWTGTKKTLDIP